MMKTYEDWSMDLTTLQSAADCIRRAIKLINSMLDDDLNGEYNDLICGLDETAEEVKYQIRRVSREAARAYQEGEDYGN